MILQLPQRQIRFFQVLEFDLLKRLQLEQHNALLNRHEFEDLFVNSPHPELFDKDGNLDRGDYLVINFPENFDPETEGWFIEDPEEDSDVW